MKLANSLKSTKYRTDVEIPCIRTLHRGSYDSISYPYRALYDWAAADRYPKLRYFIRNNGVCLQSGTVL